MLAILTKVLVLFDYILFVHLGYSLLLFVLYTKALAEIVGHRMELLLGVD